MERELLSVIIPSYNEGENIRRIFEALEEEFRDFHYDFEIIFVNDGSKDNTLQYMREPAKVQRSNTFPSHVTLGRKPLFWQDLNMRREWLRSSWTPTCSTQRI